ncbi:ABC transporter permease [Mycobacterium sp. KBS0706]|uniref:ABC transporter permease n=1 Tax=Mycobacterium sp. KBS0706 TaxID=2578109 RepID=UPI00110FF363|nr:ABC transporter permease [Mycobacterium sp. KBS0706]TSD86579.1 ABC transporter permease [Mycobacterium sp. KBS0706]
MSARVLRSLGWLLLAVILAGFVLQWVGDGGVFALGTAWIALPIVAVVIASWAALHGLSPVPGRAAGIAVPILFGAVLLWLWQVLVTGFQVPQILLPAPSQIGARFAASTDTLWVDFVQTFIRSAIPGFLIGSGAGFLTAVAIDRSPFLQRGLLPLGSAVSAMPIVGIAPVMIMWFGFDWHSKAAVVVVMTFFPMLVNALAGLEAAGAMERDLMRSYAASYWQTLRKLRLPGALPFIFNALKLNATLALIGAIVAEFFGTPIYGMGFRISTEVARLNVDMVWATILVAAIAGSASYGLLALVERATTFWHPSMREAER